MAAGSAAALTLGSAAIICRFDLSKMECLPHCEDFPHELVIAREQRSGYDHAVRASGLAMGVVLLVQVALGVTIVLQGLPLALAVAHNGTAALLLLATVSLGVAAWREA